ncbi:MAG: hypothetical protein AB1806_15830 [Acidobacteriota bacterium]
MTAHTDGHDNDRSAGRGYETRDVKAGALSKALLALAIVVVGTYAMTVGLFRFFSSREDVKAGDAPPAVNRGAPADEQQKWPEPRIQANPAGDMARLRADQDAVLRSYGWVDRQGGVVRIPIDVAMRLVLDEGLPIRQPETAPPAAGTPEPVTSPAGGGSQKMDR